MREDLSWYKRVYYALRGYKFLARDEADTLAVEMARDALRSHFQKELKWKRAWHTDQPERITVWRDQMFPAEADHSTGDHKLKVIQIDAEIYSPDNPEKPDRDRKWFLAKFSCRLLSMRPGQWVPFITAFDLDTPQGWQVIRHTIEKPEDRHKPQGEVKTEVEARAETQSTQSKVRSIHR